MKDILENLQIGYAYVDTKGNEYYYYGKGRFTKNINNCCYKNEGEGYLLIPIIFPFSLKEGSYIDFLKKLTVQETLPNFIAKLCYPKVDLILDPYYNIKNKTETITITPIDN